MAPIHGFQYNATENAFVSLWTCLFKYLSKLEYVFKKYNNSNSCKKYGLRKKTWNVIFLKFFSVWVIYLGELSMTRTVVVIFQQWYLWIVRM